MVRIPEIKICGITTVEEIKIINQLPIDYIGFVFAKSKRQVNLMQALQLQQYLREDIKTVGVFVNEDVALINRAIRDLQLDVVQLHGVTEQQMIKAINGNIWQAIAMTSTFKQALYPTNDGIDGYLFDGRTPGSGQPFNWDLMQGLDFEQKLILAGGLNHYNVAKAIQKVRAAIVDVSSGVEKDNLKNDTLIKKFVRSVKHGD
jgi:phosphoribosylanthranilate isomerase